MISSREIGSSSSSSRSRAWWGMGRTFGHPVADPGGVVETMQRRKILQAGIGDDGPSSGSALRGAGTGCAGGSGCQATRAVCRRSRSTLRSTILENADRRGR